MRAPRHYENPLCAQTGSGDAWFPEVGYSTSAETVIARNICGKCVHQSECAEWGIRNERFGIWGGLAEKDRQVIRKRQNIIVNDLRWEEGIA